MQYNILIVKKKWAIKIWMHKSGYFTNIGKW